MSKGKKTLTVMGSRVQFAEQGKGGTGNLPKGSLSYNKTAARQTSSGIGLSSSFFFVVPKFLKNFPKPAGIRKVGS